MNTNFFDRSHPQRFNLLPCLALCGICLLINVLGVRLMGLLSLPLYLDNVGTILAAAMGGPLAGVATGYLSNLINSIGDPATAYYASLTVIIALLAYIFHKGNCFRRSPRILLPIVAMALVGGGLGSVLTWVLNGNPTMEGFSAQLVRDLGLDLIDKGIVCVVAALLLALVPEKIKDRVYLRGWRQTPLNREALFRASHRRARTVSLRTKIVLIIGLASFFIALSATVFSGLMYHRATVEEHKKLGMGVADLVASVVDGDRVDYFMTMKEGSETYRRTESMLYSIRDSSPDIEYVYVYQIKPDGCHVVFDLDTEDLPGAETGTVIPFDDSFSYLLPDLMAGRPIDPIITNDTYGWLLTAYEPVYDSQGNCVCYAAADIAMGQLAVNDLHYVIRIAAMFVGIFLFVLVLVLWLAEYHVILPINSMALATGAFAYTDEEAREGNVRLLHDLDIKTGDEIENLYRSLTKTTGDTMQYITDVQEKGEAIKKMQNGLILVLADIVESRDQCTGNHVRKTAAYARVILEQMRRDGLYPDILTQEYIEDVSNSAPLHDIGKIQVSDALLNKPNKLSDEEFAQMKRHAAAGGEIINNAIAQVGYAGYLTEARNLANYHHEVAGEERAEMRAAFGTETTVVDIISGKKMKL